MLSEQDQVTILLQIGLGSPGPAFFAVKDRITISKETFKKYYAASDLIEKNKKEHREFPQRDGYHIIERKRSGKFELLLMERGQVDLEWEFKNKDELVSYLVDQMFANLGLSEK